MGIDNKKTLASGFKLCLDFVKKGIELHYNKWVDDTNNFINPAPEVNMNWEGYELQIKRYEIMLKIINHEKITQNEFNYLIIQDIINNFFKNNSIYYDNLLTNKDIIEMCEYIDHTYLNYLHDKPRIDGFFGKYSMFYNKDLGSI